MLPRSCGSHVAILSTSVQLIIIVSITCFLTEAAEKAAFSRKLEEQDTTYYDAIVSSTKSVIPSVEDEEHPLLRTKRSPHGLFKKFTKRLKKLHHGHHDEGGYDTSSSSSEESYGYKKPKKPKKKYSSSSGVSSADLKRGKQLLEIEKLLAEKQMLREFWSSQPGIGGSYGKKKEYAKNGDDSYGSQRSDETSREQHNKSSDREKPRKSTPGREMLSTKEKKKTEYHHHHHHHHENKTNDSRRRRKPSEDIIGSCENCGSDESSISLNFASRNKNSKATKPVVVFHHKHASSSEHDGNDLRRSSREDYGGQRSYRMRSLYGPDPYYGGSHSYYGSMGRPPYPYGGMSQYPHHGVSTPYPYGVSPPVNPYQYRGAMPYSQPSYGGVPPYYSQGVGSSPYAQTYGQPVNPIQNHNILNVAGTPYNAPAALSGSQPVSLPHVHNVVHVGNAPYGQPGGSTYSYNGYTQPYGQPTSLTYSQHSHMQPYARTQHANMPAIHINVGTTPYGQVSVGGQPVHPGGIVPYSQPSFGGNHQANPYSNYAATTPYSQPYNGAQPPFNPTAGVTPYSNPYGGYQQPPVSQHPQYNALSNRFGPAPSASNSQDSSRDNNERRPPVKKRRRKRPQQKRRRRPVQQTEASTTTGTGPDDGSREVTFEFDQDEVTSSGELTGPADGETRDYADEDDIDDYDDIQLSFTTRNRAQSNRSRKRPRSGGRKQTRNQQDKDLKQIINARGVEVEVRPQRRSNKPANRGQRGQGFVSGDSRKRARNRRRTRQTNTGTTGAQGSLSAGDQQTADGPSGTGDATIFENESQEVVNIDFDHESNVGNGEDDGVENEDEFTDQDREERQASDTVSSSDSGKDPAAAISKSEATVRIHVTTD